MCAQRFLKPLNNLIRGVMAATAVTIESISARANRAVGIDTADPPGANSEIQY